nr:hypothetical protein [uncultured bacterium]
MSLVLITGTPGWLGTRLVQSILQGLPDVSRYAQPDPAVRLRCLVRPGENAKAIQGPQVEIVEGDLADAAAMERFCQGAGGATLFQLAGVIHPTKGVPEFYRTNLEGTRQVLAAAEKAGVKRAVVMSSNSPIGVNPNPDHQFDESSPYNPYMNYGRSKMQMELLVKEVQGRGKLETVVVRAPWFYGTNQPERQTLFFHMVRTGKAPIVGSGENKRSMAYLDNLCQGLRLCADTPAANGQTYWIADRRPYPMNEIVDTIERLLENEFKLPCAHKRMRLPGFAGDVATVVDGLIQGMGRYHQKIHVLSEMNKTIACRIDRAECELGYAPAIELEEGMRRSIRWCLDHGHTI